MDKQGRVQTKQKMTNSTFFVVLPLSLIHFGKTNNIHIKEFYHPPSLTPPPCAYQLLKKQACCVRMQHRPFPMQLHHWAIPCQRSEKEVNVREWIFFNEM